MNAYCQRLYSASHVPLENITLAPPLELEWSWANASSLALILHRECFTETNLKKGRFLTCLRENGEEKWRVRVNLNEGVALTSDYVLGFQSSGPKKELLLIEHSSGDLAFKEPTRFGLGVLVSDDGFLGWSRTRYEHSTSITDTIARVSMDDGHEAVWEQTEDWQQDSDSRYGFDLHPICAEGRIYVGRGRDLVCLNYDSGRQIWSKAVDVLGGAENFGRWEPMYAGGLVVISVRGGMAAYQGDSGELVWSLGGETRYKAVYDDKVYVLDRESLLVVDLRSGSVLLHSTVYDLMRKKWRLRPGRLKTYPVVSDTHVFAGTEDGRLCCFDRESGEPVWHHKPDDATGYLAAVPAVVDGHICIGGLSMDPQRPASLYCYRQAGL